MSEKLPPPPELFHYTSFETAKAILETQTLWATDFRHLNDPTEFRHVKPKLIDLLVPKLKKVIKALPSTPEKKRSIRSQGGNHNTAITEADTIMRALFDTTFGDKGYFPGYIASFCSHVAGSYENENGLLSMWRGYGKNGVALVFDTAKLKEHIKVEKSCYLYNDIYFGHARYDTPDLNFSDVLKPTFLDKCVEFYNALIGRDKDRAQGLLDAPFVESLASMAVFLKHQAFVEECEVRIVALPWDQRHLDAAPPGTQGRLKEIKPSRPDRHCIELFNNDQPLPITRIIVGPQSAQDECVTELKRLTKGRGITISHSETPYRPNVDTQASKVCAKAIS